MKKITKTILLLAFIGLSFGKVNAQFVTVNDPNFRTWLIQKYPTCFNASQQMDTTCNAILSETTLLLPEYSTLSLTNISAIQYFDNLKRIYVYNNNVNTINKFPATLKSIEIKANPLSTIPILPPLLDTLIINSISQTNNIFYLSFPDSLTYIDLMNNNLIGIQTLMPPNLKTLNVAGNPFANSYFAGLINVLPPTLLNFCFANCGVTALTQLPPNLVALNCSYNQIYNLPNLPASLVHLYCDVNNLGQLPPLPANLFNLSATINSLYSLPDTLPPNLAILNISNNNIDSIPNLPQSLINLDVSGNPITELPSNFTTTPIQYLSCASCSLTFMPATQASLFYLNCSNNQITCFGNLSENLFYPNQLDLSNNPFTCVPNYVPAMDSAFVAVHPLCIAGDTINNPYNCSMAKGIAGRIYRDNNANCDYDSADNILKNIKVNFFDPINSVFSSTFSGLSGVYFNTLNPSMYIMSLDSVNNDYTYSCQYPGLDTMVTLTAGQPLAENVNFGVKCNSGFDVGVKSITPISGIAFPGQLHTIKITAGDVSQWYNLNCAQGTSGQVSITLNGPVTLSSIATNALTPSNISGNILTYNIADFGLVDIDSAFIMTLMTDTTAQSGDQICIQVSITTASADNNPSNNTYSQCYQAVNSYDPNYKEVYPKDVLPGYQDWFNYTVHFQNLGNAPAFNIRILDTLDQNLNLSTFEIIGYSHANNAFLNDKILTLKFPNIMLPDSASNPIGSQGFIQYRIKPKANMPLGTQLKNTAHIYFDFNPAVVTNTTTNHFTDVTNASSLRGTKQSQMRCYPNPAKDKLFYANIPKGSTITICNLLGEVCLTSYASLPFGEVGGAFSSLPKGIYFVRCGNETMKFIKE